MTQQVVMNKCVQRLDSLSHPSNIGSEAKNPLLTTLNEIAAIDLIGLSWMFTDMAFSNGSIVDGEKS